MRRGRNASKKTALTAMEQYELNQWLEQNEIHSNNLRRSFTDVLPLARLLSRYYPDLIDLNYYPPRNSVHNKLCNWESFNKRVLTRLGLHLSRDQMVRVARSVPGSVDLLLYSIMRVQLAAERKAREAKDSSADDEDNATEAEAEAAARQQLQLQQQQSDSQQLLERDIDAQRPRTLKQAQAVLRRSERAQSATSATMRRQSQSQSQAEELVATGAQQRGEQQQHPQQQQQQRTVLYSHYMQAVKQLQQRNDKIERFNQLSAHLENMLQLKCERIDELQQQVARLNPHAPHPPADSAQRTAETSGNNNNNNKHKNNTQHKRCMRLKKRATTRRTIQALTDRIRIPGFGFAAAAFPLKLTPNT
ncbi:sperm flagellar protein 1-like isoform X1 [Drosophila sulfurigaster albostrigata]|uniref:sperm flagellar protein 1-like isoform X1 n=1 Tax=Drosophila sulfurigaster albostrigata TaxID=89887 RepID=UPI002D218DA0|nr:sperm flagellar protein 1-like isoform X1 [Drosophila sulfurigaster albostrigata]